MHAWPRVVWRHVVPQQWGECHGFVLCQSLRLIQKFICAVKIVVEVGFAKTAIITIKLHVERASSEEILVLLSRKSNSGRCALIVVFFAFWIATTLHLVLQPTLLCISKTINEVAFGDCIVFYLLTIVTWFVCHVSQNCRQLSSANILRTPKIGFRRLSAKCRKLRNCLQKEIVVVAIRLFGEQFLPVFLWKET